MFMPSHRLIVWCSLAVSAYASAATPPHLGELDVRTGSAGMPCFTIFQKDEQRFGAPEFRAISVHEIAGGAKTLMWAMTIPPERPFLVTFRLCIPYAGRLPVLPKTIALPLQPGKVYEALIDIKPPISASAPRAYRARFCLGGKPGAALQVRTLASAAAEGKGRGTCNG
jgi:hypothetical protein